MTKDPIYTRLLELSWRRELTPGEAAQLEAWLLEHPEFRTEWEADGALNAALGHLPAVAVPSNFTARVLQAVEREMDTEARSPRPAWRSWPRLRWLPATACAALLLAAGLFSYHRHQVINRLKLAQSVAAVADVSSLPSPDILKDFETIQHLNRTPPDTDLLALWE